MDVYEQIEEVDDELLELKMYYLKEKRRLEKKKGRLVRVLTTGDVR